MGWWSQTIMGGDTPLDYEYNLYTAASIPDDDVFEEGKRDSVSSLFSSNFSRVLIAAKEAQHEPTIMYQVLGVLTMHHGLDPAREDVQEAITMALAGADQDEWAEVGGKRAEYMNAFIDQLNNYDGTAQEPESEGLFDVIADHLSSGKSGLVNKNT